MHSAVVSAVGKPVVTKRTMHNILSGKTKPQRDFSESLDRWKVVPELAEMVRKAEAEFDELDEHINVDLMLFARELRESGCVYCADVIDDILEHDKRAFAVRAVRRPQPEILKGGLAKTILNAEEVKILQDANGGQAIGIALSPLRLKTPLYALAAWEVESFHQLDAAPSDLSVCVADGGENAFGAFINVMIERTKKNAADFARDYMPDKKDGDSDDESKIKKLDRWREGKNVPHWEDVVALCQNLGLGEGCEHRAVFLFMLANYSSNATKCAKRLDMRLNVGAEYQRFLKIHLAEIKKRGRAE